MKSIFSLIVAAVFVGLGVGATLGYFEARLPATSSLKPDPNAVSVKPDAKTAVRGPLADVRETTFNFDRIEQGDKMTHDFVIANLGDAPLTVAFESHTCKCTEVLLGGVKITDRKSFQIPPGGKDAITLEWTAKTEPGPFRHGATFSSDDPTHSRMELTVEGDVVESTSLQPAALIFGTVKANSTREVSTILMSNLEPEVKVLRHELSDPTVADMVVISVTPVEKSGLPYPEALCGVRITATLKAGATLGPFFSWLTLETNLKNAVKTLAITGTVAGDISVHGTGWIEDQGVLKLGNIASKAGARVQLSVAVRGEHAAKTQLSVASVDPPELQATLGEPKVLRPQLVHFPLIVAVPAGTRPMARITRDANDTDTTSGDGEIVLQSTHPDTKEIRLRVRFTVE
jgi:hypothetical protein